MGLVGDLETQNQTQKPEVLQWLNQCSSPESDGSRLDPGRSIAEAIQNVELEQTQNWVGEDRLGDDFGGEGGFEGAKDQYPLRPYAEDCSFYVRNGYCKFGLSCKFNHPVKKRAMNQGARERSKDELVEQASNTECKYYRTAAGCKFGETCRYRHQSEQTETPPELNYLGLPLREGVIVCDFYLRNGSCGYGATCRFHHPEPTENLRNVTPTLKPLGELNGSFLNHNGESDPSQELGTASQPALASWSSHLMSDETVSYVDTHLSNAPMMDSISGEVDATYEWNGSQAAAYPEEDPWQIISPDNLVNRNVSTYNRLQIELDEFPQRLGQPDCDYYMRTGNCKYGSTCKYHHPKIQYSRYPEKALSQKSFSPKSFYPQETAWQINSAIGADIFKNKTYVSGYHQPKIEVAEFPERPGEPDCGYYMKTGDCKCRSACKYHHPKENRVSSLPVCSLSDKGLPLRPDEKICWHYEQYGICKFGRSCLFDHPVDYFPSIPVRLQSPVPSSSYGTACEGTAMTGSAAGSEILIS